MTEITLSFDLSTCVYLVLGFVCWLINLQIFTEISRFFLPQSLSAELRQGRINNNDNNCKFFFFQSRAALSLLGYCYFQVQSFDAAADW